MRFEGYMLADQRAAGTLGVDGQQRFPLPPLPVGNGLLVTREAVYQFDEERNRILLRGQRARGETIVGLDRSASASRCSASARCTCTTRATCATRAPAAAAAARATPGQVGNLTRIELMELLDGVLVSFSFTRGRHNGTACRTSSCCAWTSRARRRRSPTRAQLGYGPVYIYNSWYTSPLLFACRSARPRCSPATAAGRRRAPPVPAHGLGDRRRAVPAVAAAGHLAQRAGGDVAACARCLDPCQRPARPAGPAGACGCCTRVAKPSTCGEAQHA
jgi:hypothetical protein